MLLNRTAVYGLRAVATLAQLAPGESINAAELSRRTGVPRQYLSKVMRKLVLARMVLGRRGHGGGFCLARAPQTIRLGDILEALDQPLDDECVFGFPSCGTDHPCALHPVWAKLKECVARWTDECTMADLGPRPPTAPPASSQGARRPPRGPAPKGRKRAGPDA